MLLKTNVKQLVHNSEQNIHVEIFQSNSLKKRLDNSNMSAIPKPSLKSSEMESSSQ